MCESSKQKPGGLTRYGFFPCYRTVTVYIGIENFGGLCPDILHFQWVPVSGKHRDLATSAAWQWGGHTHAPKIKVQILYSYVRFAWLHLPVLHPGFNSITLCRTGFSCRTRAQGSLDDLEKEGRICSVINIDWICWCHMEIWSKHHAACKWKICCFILASQSKRLLAPATNKEQIMNQSMTRTVQSFLSHLSDGRLPRTGLWRLPHYKWLLTVEMPVRRIVVISVCWCDSSFGAVVMQALLCYRIKQHL